MLANYNHVPQNLIETIVKANDTRKDHITNMILQRNPRTVGIYRLDENIAQFKNKIYTRDLYSKD